MPLLNPGAAPTPTNRPLTGARDYVAPRGYRFAQLIAHAGVSDVTLSSPCDALYVVTAGTVCAKMHDGNWCTFTGVPAGTVLPLSILALSGDTSGTHDPSDATVVALWF